MSTDGDLRHPSVGAVDVRAASAVDPDLPSRRETTRLVLVLWAVVAVFAAVTLARSLQVGVPLRDPGGRMFQGRLTDAVLVLVALALADAVVRSGVSWRGAATRLRDRWTPRRLALVGTGLLAYHVVYVCYRNLKSWVAFRPDHDDAIGAFEKAVLLGHTPASLLHDLLGEQTAAPVLSVVYRSFTYLVPLSVVGTLALLPRVRQAYVFLCSATWVWVLGLGSYYLVPTLGPFASAPGDFTGLATTAITSSQAEYLRERAQLLADPSAGDSFASISAFASLHTGFTCMVLVAALHFGWRRTSAVLAVYLGLVMVSTVYFGWHFVVDDLAGIALAVLAVGLGRLMVHPPGRVPREPAG